MISNLLAWLFALIATAMCELNETETCSAPPPPAATAASGSTHSTHTANPKIINEI